MNHATLARSTGPNRPAPAAGPESRCGMAPHRGDVTTVRAAGHVRLQHSKRIEKLQAHAPSHRTAGTASLPVVIPGIGLA